MLVAFQPLYQMRAPSHPQEPETEADVSSVSDMSIMMSIKQQLNGC